MTGSIDGLLQQYENGRLSRRELIAALALLAAPRPAAAQESLFRARALNHVNIGVEDLDRSEAFYRRMLGLPARRWIVGDAYALDFPGGGFISLCPVAGGNCSVKRSAARPGEIDHFGIGIDGFDADRVVLELSAVGVQNVRNAVTSVLVPDPDGTIVQLSAADERFSGVNRGC